MVRENRNVDTSLDHEPCNRIGRGKRWHEEATEITAYRLRLSKTCPTDDLKRVSSVSMEAEFTVFCASSTRLGQQLARSTVG